MNTSSMPRADEANQFLRPMDTKRAGWLTFDRSSETQLSQYLGIVRRRKWIVIAAILTAIIIAIFYTLSATRLYRATTTLQISRESTRVVDVQDLQPQSSVSGTEFYQTQYGLLQSRSVALETVRRLRLADNATFLTGYSGADPDAVMARPRQDRVDQAVGLVEAHTLVTPVRNSGLVEVSFDSTDAALSARIANALAQAFITSNLQRRFDATAYARRFLENELAKVRQRLESSERAVVDYSSREQLIEINRRTDSQGNTTGQSLNEMDLDTLNRSLGEARAERIAAETRAQAAGGRGLSSEALNSQALSQLQGKLAEAEGEYARNLATFKPDYPVMVALRQQIDALRRAVNQQGSSIGQTLTAAANAARARENLLQERVNQLKGAVIDQNRRRIQYNIFQRDADTNRALYDSLLNRYKEIGVAGGIGVNNVAVVDEARQPGSPYTPKLFANLLLALIGGAIAGLTAAFIRDQLDDAIKAPADLEKILDLPLLGVIPRVSVDRPADELRDRSSMLSEAYLAVQTSLNFSTSEGVPKLLAVTSANPAEGKSTTAYAIAATLARLGKQVLLIDADMRNPSVHRMLDRDNKHGLVELLTHNATLAQVTSPSEQENLAIVTAGPIPPNPAELLTGPVLREQLDLALRTYDHVVLDAPPILGLSDAPLITSAVQNTVFVIAANSTTTKSAIGSLRRLVEAHAHVIGAVLTKFEAAEHGYGYNYSYTYGAKKGLLGR